MNKLTATIRSQGILLLFGFITTISLFLGDGKQPAIDVAWASEILLLYVIYRLQHKKFFILPRELQIAWVILLGYCLICSIFSDSVGYSVSAAVRLFDAYLVYYLFYSIAEKKHTGPVVIGIIITGAVATIASFGCLLFPGLVSWLPQMNLLYASYGHNQLAGLLLFCIPMVLSEGSPLSARWKKTAFLLFLFGIIFSFARGAWILLSVYFVFLFVSQRLAGKFYTSAAIVFVGVVAGLLVTMFLISPRIASAPSVLSNGWFYKQTIKPPIYESRIQYWLQAMRAIEERPIFGSGPGTFYLQSVRLQKLPSSYSWFAHSFILEQFVEIGLVGVVLWSILFMIQWRLLKLHPSPLFTGVVLTFIYGLFEYNLNFLVIWLFFWAALGWLTGSEQSKKTEIRRLPLFVLLGASFLLLFSALSVIGAVEIKDNDVDRASLLMPFNTDVVKTSIEKRAETGTFISQRRTSQIAFFHKKNSEVMYDLARASPASCAAPLYERALMYDPQNTQYASGFVERFLKEKNTSVIGEAIRQLRENVLPEKSRITARQGLFTSSAITALYTSSLFEKVGQPTTVEEYFSKTVYFLGLSLLNSNPNLTRGLWVLARDASPGWGYFHVELASLEYYVFKDERQTRQTLIDCQRDKYAKTLCQTTLMYFSDIPPVGAYYDDIKNI